MRTAKTKYVTIQSHSEPDDSFRGIAGAWVDVASVFASLEQVGAREYLQLQQTEAQITHRVRMNYRSGVTAKMRLRMARTGLEQINPENDAHYRIFHIESVINVNEANRELELMVKEQV